jgi:hypothetical protein
MRDKLYAWWKRQPKTVRKPFVFALGLVLISIAPVVGWIPGPGGIVVFLLGIAVLASEFDWAESLQEFFLKTVPKEVKKRWHPTPKWELTFDATALLLLVSGGILAYNRWLAPVASFGIAGVCLFLFNRDRLNRLKKYLRK